MSEYGIDISVLKPQHVVTWQTAGDGAPLAIDMEDVVGELVRDRKRGSLTGHRHKAERLNALSDRMVAGFRLLLAGSALLAVCIDPSEPAYLVPLTCSALTFYTLYCATIYAITWPAEAFSKTCLIVLMANDILVESLRIHDRLAAEIFQMAAEALSNVQRHTSATSVTVNLEEEENGCVVVKVENEVMEPAINSEFVPRSISARAEALGGYTKVSVSDCRTVVQVGIPI